MQYLILPRTLFPAHIASRTIYRCFIHDVDYALRTIKGAWTTPPPDFSIERWHAYESSRNGIQGFPVDPFDLLDYRCNLDGHVTTLSLPFLVCIGEQIVVQDIDLR